MLNTTGIQSTGPQGLPGSSGQAAVVDEQDAAQFEAMMSESGSASKLDELQAKLKNTQERYSAALARADKALQKFKEFDSWNREEANKALEERSKALDEAGLAFVEKKAIESEIFKIAKEYFESDIKEYNERSIN